MSEKPLPKNLLEAIRYFADLDVATEFVAGLRWPEGPTCTQCGSQEYSYLKTRRLWKCKACKNQYSVKKGTIFEDSPIPLDKWLAAIWLIANSKNGISSHELGRAIGLTQKSAWFVLHRIRLAMQTGSFEKFDGVVEVDETYVGGRLINMHKSKKKALKDRVGPIGGGGKGKTPVAGALKRGEDGKPSQVRASVVPDTYKATLRGHVTDSVQPGATVYSDKAAPYWTLGDLYTHEMIDHVVEYARGKVTTNSIENFWALLKRGIVGTYVQAAPEHLHRYVDERVFTFNHRGTDDLGRFRAVLSTISGRRLTYADLTGNA